MITASIVKELRDKTSAPMMDCKKVLTETNGDLEASIKLLRERGIMKSAKMSDRAANEGVITARVNADATSGILLEVNCETDFVSKNESFQAFVAEIADALAASAAAGAISRKSIAKLSPVSARCTNINPPAPIFPARGSVTASENAAVTAASIALPPSRKIAAAAALACFSCVTTIPP